MTLKEKLFQVMRLRLELIAPVASTWSQALSQFAQVSQAPTAVQTIGTVVDQIWTIVGDTSTQVDS
jgi:ubiquinone biosynthesis protein COQ9